MANQREFGQNFKNIAVQQMFNKCGITNAFQQLLSMVALGSRQQDKLFPNS